MILIGLHGRRGSGKDTAFGFIKEWAEGRNLSAVRRGFADKLKQSAAIALGFVGDPDDAIVLMDELKLFGEITTTIPNQSVMYTIEGRKFLQLYGTEAHRDIFGDEFWVDALLPMGNRDYPPEEWSRWKKNFTVSADKLPASMVQFGPQPADIAVVTDVRFENEARRIKDLGGQVWEIERDTGTEDSHASEVQLPRELVDFTIPNNKSLEEFQSQVRAACVGELHMRLIKNHD